MDSSKALWGAAGEGVAEAEEGNDVHKACHRPGLSLKHLEA